MSRVFRTIVILAAVAGLSFTAVKVADAAPANGPQTSVEAHEPPGGTCITCL